MKEPGDRRWMGWLAPAATVALLALFARSIDWATVMSSVGNADAPVLLGAAGANLTTLVVKGLRWSMFLDAVGAPGVAQAVGATLSGAALNGLVIANGGDAARVALVARRRGVSSAHVLASLALDRLCDVLSYVALFVVAAFVLPLTPELERWRLPSIVGLMTLALVAASLTRSSAHSTTGAHGTANGVATVRGRLGQYRRDLFAMSSSIATGTRMTASLALSLVAWAGQWATYHFVAHAASFPVSATTSFLAMVTVNASFLIRLTPGNVGVFQFLYALATSAVGMGKDEAVGVALLIQAVQYVPVTFIGLLLMPVLARRDAHVRRDESAMEVAGRAKR